MLVRTLAAMLCAGLLCTGIAIAQDQSQSQALFRDILLKDTATASGVKRLLRTNAGFVTPRPTFADLTGDGKMDAIVTVENGGAAGAVAAYVFTADGSSDGALRVVFRSQSLYQGRVGVNAPTLTVIAPIYARGGDVCCARRATERDYAWDAAAKAFRRTAIRTVDLTAATKQG